MSIKKKLRNNICKLFLKIIIEDDRIKTRRPNPFLKSRHRLIKKNLEQQKKDSYTGFSASVRIGLENSLKIDYKAGAANFLIFTFEIHCNVWRGGGDGGDGC